MLRLSPGGPLEATALGGALGAVAGAAATLWRQSPSTNNPICPYTLLTLAAAGLGEVPESAEEGVLATGLEVWQLRTLALGFVWGKAAGLALSVRRLQCSRAAARPSDRLVERCGCWAGGVRGVEEQGRAAA